MNPTVLAALIEGGCNIVATVVPAVIALVISLRWMGDKRATNTAYSALREIQYLREVIRHMERISNTNSLAARKAANNDGFTSTQLFTKAKLQRKLETYERLTNRSLPLE
ncbi:hypothetical protein [Vibrio sp. Hal054]|uniref:hypothetical protein n=1 Tax=Vibrio sp. Hal054 TaxID=3035158 RepID=UPI00301D88A1